MPLQNIITGSAEKPIILAPKLVYRFRVSFCTPLPANIDAGVSPQYEAIPYLRGLTNQVTVFDQGYETLDGSVNYGALEVQFQDDVTSGARRGIEQVNVNQSLDVDYNFAVIFEVLGGSDEILERTIYKGCRFSELIFGTYSYAGNTNVFKATIRDPEKFSIEPTNMVKQFLESEISGTLSNRNNSNGISHTLSITFDSKETQFADEQVVPNGN